MWRKHFMRRSTNYEQKSVINRLLVGFLMSMLGCNNAVPDGVGVRIRGCSSWLYAPICYLLFHVFRRVYRGDERGFESLLVSSPPNHSPLRVPDAQYPSQRIKTRSDAPSLHATNTLERCELLAFISNSIAVPPGLTYY